MDVYITFGLRNMNIASGIKLLDEIEGAGEPAARGDSVIYNLRGFLSRGDEVPMNTLSPDDRAKLLAAQPDIFTIREGGELINFACRIGKRDAIAGIEYSLVGMKVGGFRKVKVSPHLAYRDGGLYDKIPANAVITFHIWMNRITKTKAEPSASADGVPPPAKS